MLAADDEAERLASLPAFKVPLRSHYSEEECIDLDNDSDQHQHPDSDFHLGSGYGEGDCEDTIKPSQVEQAALERKGQSIDDLFA